MADIDLERKKSGGMGWLWGLLALIALIALVWWLWPDNEADVAGYDTQVESMEPATPAATPAPMTGGALSIGDIKSNPEQYVGQSFPTGEVNVAEVPTDRGFWIEEQGERLLAIIIDGPQEVPLDINPEQTLMVTGGTLRDASYLPEMPGQPLDTRTRELVEQEDVYLVVDENNIEIREGGEPQPGTTPAQGVGGN